jgi:hypothetical protein
MKTVFVITVLFFLSGIVQSQTEYFNERYSISGHIASTNISIIVKDSSYFISPITLKSWASLSEAWIIEIDGFSADTSYTSKLIVDSSDITDAGILELHDNRIVDVLTLYDLDSFNYAIVFYTEEGLLENIVIDNKKFAYLTPQDIQETHDHGFILTGIVRHLPFGQGGNHDVVLIRTDSLGNELWFKTLGGAGQQQGWSVAVCDDGGFIVAALDGKEVWIIRTDSVGTMLWERFYGSTVWGNAGPQRILQTRDGGYIFASGWGTEEFGINDWIYRPWIQKIDANGDTLWAWFSVDQDTAAFSDYVTDIYEDNQGNLIACGQELIPNWDTSSIVRHKWEGFVMKLDPAGNEIWKHHYYHPEASNPYASHFLYRIQPTPDGGYVAAGYLALPDTGTQDSWVIKVDSNGCLTPNCLVTGLPQIRRQNHPEVTVYPNPTSGTIHLELPQRMAMYRIVVLSLNGKQLNAVNTTYQKNVTLQLDQPPGVYFVQVWEKDQLIFEEKVIVR